jgi:subtilase family serine protease
VGPATHDLLLLNGPAHFLPVLTPDLAPGESMDFMVDVPGALPGDVVRIRADDNDEIQETDETNNIFDVVVPAFSAPAH